MFARKKISEILPQNRHVRSFLFGYTKAITLAVRHSYKSHYKHFEFDFFNIFYRFLSLLINKGLLTAKK